MNACKIFWWAFVIQWLFPFFLQADDLYLYHSARSLALGKATVAQNAEWDSPASLITFENRLGCLIGYQNNYFMKQLSTYRLGLSYRFDWLESRVQLSRFGYETYNETLLSLNLSKQLSEHWLIGIRLNGLVIQYPEGKRSSYLSPEAALSFFFTRWGIAAHVANLRYTVWQRGESVSVLPAVYRIGFFGRPLPELLLTGELFKSSLAPFSGRAGIEYLPLKTFSLRLGFYTSPFVPSIGVGWKYRKFGIDTSFSWHSVLGISSALQIAFYL